MPEITIKDVEYVANLARMSLHENEKKDLLKNLQEIVAYVGKLNELDGEIQQKNIQPTYHAWAGKGTLIREDEVKPSVNRQEVLDQAPEAKDGAFVVPKIIE